MSSLRMSKLSVLTKGAAPRVGGAGLSRRVASSTSNVRRNTNVNVGGVAVRAQTERDSQPAGRRTAESPDMYPHPDLIEKTLADFPDAAIANYEQGMCLMLEAGYTFLDVRSTPEYEDDGNPRGAVNIPLINTKKKWNLETGEITYDQTANADFLTTVEKKFPNKEEAKLLIVCSTGTARAIQALQILDEAGYVNIVGLKGGFNKWTTVFTPKLDRRGTDVKYTTVYQADGDAMGLHSTGAGFGKTDYVDFNLNSIDNTDWIDWEEAVKQNA